MEVFGELIALMANTDESEDKLPTFHDIKESLEEYFFSKLRSLAFILIDFLNDLVRDKKGLKEAWESPEE